MRISAGSVSAPGKVVLGGEYAVLHGAPAIVAAVDRRAVVNAEAIAGGQLELCMPGIVEGCRRFRSGADGRLDWLDETQDPGAYALFASVWQVAAERAQNGTRLTLDTRSFRDAASGSKFGLGSSAALAVALSALLAPRDSDSLLRDALAAHRMFQGGAGSGVDIACAVHGGVIACHRDGEFCEALAWPQGLHAALLWSGTPAATPAKLHRLQERLEDPARHASLARLCDESRELLTCWKQDDSRALFAQFGRYSAALHGFDSDQKLGIYSAGHAGLHAAADHAEVVYKPCGAGGGDVGVALATDAAALERFLTTAGRHGFVILDVRLGAPGVKFHGRQA